MKKTVGRPSTDKAFRVRTKAWFFAVSLASNMNAGELEIYFAPPAKRDMYKPGNRPRHWEKYMTGLICPKNKPDLNGRMSIVERVEECFPGTAMWVTLPFWLVLSNAYMEMHELKAIYSSLSLPVRELIIMEGAPDDEIFWRRPARYSDLFDQLITIGGLDAATAVLALIKEAELTQNQLQHQRGLGCWAVCAKCLRSHPVLSHVMEDINKIIEDRFTGTVYANKDGTHYSMEESEVRSILN